MALEMQKETKATAKSTQAFLRMSEIKEDTVIMNDGTLRAILAVSSTNFDLKSEEEQTALIYNYQRFLNSLDFPVQILMQSRKMEIGEYIEKLKHLAERQTNELLKVQTSEYIEFINRLVENANIMNKNFYLIIPYSQSINPPSKGFFAKLFKANQTVELGEKLERFKKYGEFLNERVNSATANLSALGLRGIRLRTEEIIELYYNSFNFESGPLIDASKLGDIKILESEKKQ